LRPSSPRWWRSLAARWRERDDDDLHDAEQYACPRKHDVHTTKSALQSAHRCCSTSTTSATPFDYSAADAIRPLRRPERSEFPGFTVPLTDARWTRFNRRHRGRFRFVYTPKHASWVNQIEIWFSILHRRALKNAHFRTATEMVARIDGFIRHWNRKLARPFRWTFRGTCKHAPRQPTRRTRGEAPRRRNAR
jgi:hypothetical protein